MMLPNSLARELDAVVKERGASSRSQWVADLIRSDIAEHGMALQHEDALAGTVTIVYRAGVARVSLAMADTLSGFRKEVISSQHVFLEDRQSLEVLIVQGSTARLRSMSDALRKVRGVQQVRLTTTMALLPPLHGSRPS